MKVYDRIYIDGAWIASTGKGRIDVINPSTEEVMASIPEGTPEDVGRAVNAARSAFESWSMTPVATRVDLLRKLAAGLGNRMKEIGETIASEVGMPIGLATAIQAGLPIANTNNFATLLEG